MQMYEKPVLSLDQVQKALTTMLDKATQEPDRPVAIAIVDDLGNLFSFARMDRCRVIPQRLAIRKAYTAALSGQDTLVYADRLKGQGRSVAEMGDPNLAAVQGGVVILHPTTGFILGGIGVSGLSAQEDEDLARLGVQALGIEARRAAGAA
jgi:glc operon protein GlcG